MLDHQRESGVLSQHVPRSAPPLGVTIRQVGPGTVVWPGERLADQMCGLQRWQAARRATEQSAQRPGLTREGRLDAARQLDVRRREHQAILDRIEQSWQHLQPLPARRPVTAVVAHSHRWTSQRLREELTGRAVEVVAAVDNGADAVGVCVVEQPALVVVDELLAMRSGRDVTAELRQFCPDSVVVGYVSSPAAIAELLAAGAASVLTRRVPPAQAAHTFTGLVHSC